MTFRARLTTVQAIKLAALRAISADLEDVVAFCRRLAQLTRDRDENDAPRDEIDLQAFWIAALVIYARCFDVGRRGFALTKEDVLAAGLADEWHQTFIGLRNEHFAHAVDRALEEFVVDAVISDPSDRIRRVEAILISGHKRTAASTEYVEHLHKMAVALRTAVDSRIEVIRDALLVWTQARPIEELYANPARPQLLPQRTGPRVRVGSRRRRK